MEKLTIQNIAQMTDWLSVKRTFENWKVDKVDEMYGAFVYLNYTEKVDLNHTLLFLDSGLEREFPLNKISLIQKYDLAYTDGETVNTFEVEEWSHIASITVESASLDILKAEELIALVIYEMTFYAFSIEELRVFWSLLEKRIESEFMYQN